MGVRAVPVAMPACCSARAELGDPEGRAWPVAAPAAPVVPVGWSATGRSVVPVVSAPPMAGPADRAATPGYLAPVVSEATAVPVRGPAAAGPVAMVASAVWCTATVEVAVPVASAVLAVLAVLAL